MNLRAIIGFIFCFFPFFGYAAAQPFLEGQNLSCEECHQQSNEEYLRSRMAVAATTSTFLQEWETKDRPHICLSCHSPTAGPGITCADCHRGSEHPFGKIADPETCATCHDAPGEVTLRSFHRSGSARRGKLCVDCHLAPDQSGHEFLGPSTPGFLDKKVFLGVSLRREMNEQIAIFDIRHQAGHALPGGTTGRSVWLIVEILDNSGRITERHTHRFGWFHDPEQGWLDKTLPPDSRKIVELPLGEVRGGQLQAKLVYRFVAGDLSKFDLDQVTLDQLSVELVSGYQR